MPPITRSVVRRRNWRWSPGNEHTPRGWVCFPGPGTAVADFDFFDDAEADWGKREAAVRLKMNPFECGPLPMVTSFPEPILRDFPMDTGIEPPAPGIAWDAWWASNREQLSDEQRSRVWQAADKVRFFEVTEETVGPEVHVLVDVTCEERGGVGTFSFDIELFCMDPEPILISATEPIDIAFGDRVESHSFLRGFRMIPFEKPGLYEFRLFARLLRTTTGDPLHNQPRRLITGEPLRMETQT